MSRREIVINSGKESWAKFLQRFLHTTQQLRRCTSVSLSNTLRWHLRWIPFLHLLKKTRTAISKFTFLSILFPRRSFKSHLTDNTLTQEQIFLRELQDHILLTGTIIEGHGQYLYKAEFTRPWSEENRKRTVVLEKNCWEHALLHSRKSSVIRPIRNWRIGGLQFPNNLLKITDFVNQKGCESQGHGMKIQIHIPSRKRPESIKCAIAFQSEALFRNFSWRAPSVKVACILQWQVSQKSGNYQPSKRNGLEIFPGQAPGHPSLLVSLATCFSLPPPMWILLRWVWPLSHSLIMQMA